MSKKNLLAVRIHPSQDVRQALQDLCVEHELIAAAIVSAVGSLRSAVLRTGTGEFIKLDGPLEIVSLSGTLSTNGNHVHTCVATKKGDAFGGHLVDGCVINTTLELVIQNLSDEFVFERVDDPATGYKELSITRKAE